MKATSLLAGSAVALLFHVPAHAQKEITGESVTCRSGTMTVVAKEEKMVVFTIDHRGVTQSKNLEDVFHNSTQHCVGSIAVIDGKPSGTGWCKTVIAKTGDWVVTDWTASDKPGQGTWSFRYGTGEFKGVTGGGTYRSLGQTRPMEVGTYQNCVLVKGTRRMPG